MQVTMAQILRSSDPQISRIRPEPELCNVTLPAANHTTRVFAWTRVCKYRA